VLPAPARGVPFVPVEFTGTTVTSYVTQAGKLGYSLKASGVRSPSPVGRAAVRGLTAGGRRQRERQGRIVRAEQFPRRPPRLDARPGNRRPKGVHLRDLRHTGNQFSAEAGANIRELMERMGHDSTRAALIYLHSSADRQRWIADQVGRNAKAALSKLKRSGTQRARDRSGKL
jgi:hypothetical protein